MLSGMRNLSEGLPGLLRLPPALRHHDRAARADLAGLARAIDQPGDQIAGFHRIDADRHIDAALDEVSTSLV
jgi:hypothetical protein